MTLDVKNDDKWIGKEITITNINGQILLHHIIRTNTDKINIGGLNRGIYFIHGSNDGEKISLKFIKL